MGLMAVLLSLSRGKIDYYLLPLLPPASLVIGRYFGAVPWGRLDRIWGRVVLLLVGLLVVVTPAAIWQLPSDWLPPPALFLALALLLLGGSLACLMTALSDHTPAHHGRRGHRCRPALLQRQRGVLARLSSGAATAGGSRGCAACADSINPKLR